MNTRIAVVAALALTLGACASSPSSRYGQSSSTYYPPAQTRCYDCGQVQRIETIYVTGESNGTGAVLGGIVGGVLGNQVGKGDGKKAATVAGVVGGAVAGNAIEKRTTKQDFRITVRMDDGRVLALTQGNISPNLREGSYVRVANGQVILLR